MRERRMDREQQNSTESPMFSVMRSSPEPKEQTTSQPIHDLPTEVLDVIISHCYNSWSLSISNRSSRGSLPVDGLSPTAFHLVSHNFACLAVHHERASFTGQLIFTTSSTQWRILQRLRLASPARLAWIIDHVSALVFCSPPLFTNRIPWTSLPGLRRIELDYSYRSANFRCQGTSRELEGGYLDPLIVQFARDTERFDVPLVEDAWKAVENSTSSVDESVDLATVIDSSIVAEVRRVEVLVIKTMNIFESPSTFHLPLQNDMGVKLENWKLRVSATHKGRIEDVKFQIVSGNHDVPFGETVVWTLLDGYRETVPFEQIPIRELRVMENTEREQYLVNDIQT